MQLRMLLAFFAATEHCWLIFSLLLTRIPGLFLQSCFLASHPPACPGAWVQFLLHKFMLTTSQSPLCASFIGNGFQEGMLHYPLCHWGEVEQPGFSQFPVFPLLGDRSDICFLAVFQNSSNLHEFSQIIERCLTVTLASSHSTCGYILPGPMDYCLSSLFKCSLTLSSSTKLKSSLLRTSLLVSGAWDSWQQILLVKETKKAFSTSAFFMFFLSKSPSPFSSKPTFCMSSSVCPSCSSPDSTPGGLSLS